MLACLQMIDDSRDKVKLEQLYLTYKMLMVRAAMNILHNKQDAEDAVHDAFLTIAKNIKKISDVRSPKTRAYIVIIVERKAVDLYRARRRHAEKALTELPGTDGCLEPGGGSLADCIDRLPERDRQAVTLRYAHGYRLDEIASIFNISYAAAAKLVERAKEKLEKLCREEGIL